MTRIELMNAIYERLSLDDQLKLVLNPNQKCLTVKHADDDKSYTVTVKEQNKQ